MKTVPVTNSYLKLEKIAYYSTTLSCLFNCNKHCLYLGAGDMVPLFWWQQIGVGMLALAILAMGLIFVLFLHKNKIAFYY